MSDAEPRTTCPKCGAEQPAGDACRRCGLIYARWQGAAGDGAAYTGIAGELWTACVEGWEEAKRHDAFLLFCRREGSLPYAAGRYRSVLKERPGDPVATARLAELVKLAEFAAQAEMTQNSMRRASDRGPYRSAIMLFLGAVVLLGAGVAVFYLIKMIR